ncbi:MAG: c-type cytochrome [Burkholderiales bacterium]|nr:c-type cytochrome [Burkholderiales bacterium]
MNRIRTILATIAALAILGVVGAAGFIWVGFYNVGATRQHLQPVYSVLEFAMHRSVRLHALNIDTPPLEDEAMVRRGATCFDANCVQCHGAPGVAQDDIGKSMQPLPGPLVDATQNFHPRELYWITRHGIRLSGMPAWEFRLTDGEIWDVVAFLRRLPMLTPQAYPEMARPQLAAFPCGRDVNIAAMRAPDVPRAKQALYQYACSACHTIPGVTSSFPNVGPPLAGLASRTLIAGTLPNTQDNMVIWLRGPNKVKPHTAMPDLRVTQEDAADMAAYLATLR